MKVRPVGVVHEPVGGLAKRRPYGRRQKVSGGGLAVGPGDHRDPLVGQQFA